MNLEKGTVLRCTKDFVMIEDGLGTDIRAGDVAFKSGKLYEIVNIDISEFSPRSEPTIYELVSDICWDGMTHSMEQSDLEGFFEEAEPMGHASEALDRTELF